MKSLFVKNPHYIIFDGSCFNGEGISVIGRRVDDKLVVTQKVLDFKVLNKSVNVDELG